MRPRATATLLPVIAPRVRVTAELQAGTLENRNSGSDEMRAQAMADATAKAKAMVKAIAKAMAKAMAKTVANGQGQDHGHA